MIKDCPVCTAIYKGGAYAFRRPLILEEYLKGCLHNVSDNQIPTRPKSLFEQVVDSHEAQRVKDNELIEDGKRFRKWIEKGVFNSTIEELRRHIDDL